MVTYSPFNKIGSTIAVVAFVAIIRVGLLSTNGHCDAFSAVEHLMTRARQPSPSMKTATMVSIGPLALRKMQPRGISVSSMVSSNKYGENVLTISKDEFDASETLVTTADGNDGNNTPPFDEAAWRAYKITMEEIMTQKRVIKKCNDETISRCRSFLLSYEQSLSSVPNIMDIIDNSNIDKKEALESSLRNQAERFQQYYNFTTAETEFINRCLVYMGDASAKIQSKRNNNNGIGSDTDIRSFIDPRLSIGVSWHKLKEMGHLIRENSMSTYMYILSNNGESDDENNAFVDDALLEVVTCHDEIYRPSEKTVTIRLKSLIARGKIDEAEDMVAACFNDRGCISSPSSISSAKKENRGTKENTEGRLRTYMPLMEHYCRNGTLMSIMRIYRKMQDCHSVHWDVESYSLLLSSLARLGYFFDENDEQVNETNDTNDDANLYGPFLFDKLVSNMANDILELTEKTSKEISDAFQIGINEYVLRENLITDKNNKDQTLLPKSVVVERVEIPKGNGTCPITGVKLRLLALDEMQRQHVHDKLLEMSRTTTEEFITSIKARSQKPKKNSKGKGKVRKTIQDAELEIESYGYEELLKFSTWLDNREGNLYTTIVDGANVAYYGHSNVHYSSLKKIVEKLESMGERPLVVMPEKYTSKSFACRPNFYQKLTSRDQDVIDWLRDNEMIYEVPRLNLDDYFWMLASVSNQTNATLRDDFTIPISDDQGRFPGMRPMLISNDQMRDHKLDLLEPREFRRWSSCHIVNYDIALYEKNEWDEERRITFVPADSFSSEIQGNPHTNGKDTVWHFPISDSADWLCIWIKR